MSNVPQPPPDPNSSKRLFTVTIETEIVVVANSPSEAEVVARDSMRHIDDDQWSALASAMVHMPSGWASSAIPFGPGVPEDPDRTVEEWIQRGAAPKYAELLQKLSTGRTK